MPEDRDYPPRVRPVDVFEPTSIAHEFYNDVLRVRDAIQPIADGSMESHRCPSGEPAAYGGVPKMRRVTAKDAQKIAKTAVFVINRAANKFLDDIDRVSHANHSVKEDIKP